MKKREVILPGVLMEKFLMFSAANTKADIETCGILCGNQKNNKLYITHVIVPPQHATSNTCVTSGEEKLIQVQIEKDLLTLGWIHTHPTQTCFLSSVDLHTQLSYQIMMPESLAIVLAPSVTPNSGVFCVTNNGITVLSNCVQRGFHEHLEGDIYEVASHISMDWKAKTELIDIRDPPPKPQQQPKQQQQQQKKK